MKGVRITVLIIIILVILGVVGWFVAKAAQCPDSDNDGLDNCLEVQIYHTDKYDPDTDSDGFSDGEEVSNGFAPYSREVKPMKELDSDADQLNDEKETRIGSNLFAVDTDNDGVGDFDEIEKGGDPLNSEVTEGKIEWAKKFLFKD